MKQLQAFRMKRSRQTGHRLYDQYAILAHDELVVADFVKQFQPVNISATRARASRAHGCVFSHGSVVVCRNSDRSHREAIAKIDPSGELYDQDIILATGARSLADIPLGYEEDEVGYITVRIYRDWAKCLRKHHGHLFPNEAVMALIDRYCKDGVKL
jgi:hypothetical protein